MHPKRRKDLEKTINIYQKIIVLVFLILFMRLGWLQLVQVEIYRTKAEDNRMRLVTIPATRGNIVTNDGVVIATDHPSFQVSITYLGLKNQDQVVKRLAEILNDPEITAEYINDLIKKHQYRLYEPIVVKRNISIETVTAIESRRGELPGVTIEPAPERIYPYENLAGHVLGYLGEVNEELGKEGYEEYKLGDLIGQIGVERQFDQYLKGEEGFRQVEVNVKNRPIREITTIAPEPGNDVVLTINFNLQKVMDETFDAVLAELQQQPRSDKANAGAAVLLDVKTGKVLAMSSRPSDKITQQNRAIQGRYIPGSTFKMITGMAALEAGKVTPEETIYNPGRYWYPPFIKSVAPVGPMNFYSAIAKSDNVYFQEMGRRAGIDGIAKIGTEFGLDKPTGIDLPYESKGNEPTEGLPTPAKRTQYFSWAEKITNIRYEGKIANIKEKYENPQKYFGDKIAELNKKIIKEKENGTLNPQRLKDLERLKANYEQEKLKILNMPLEKRAEEKNDIIARLEAQWKIDLRWNTTWHDVDTFNIAIGQGRQNYTPLQLANYVAGIANNGIRYEPYVVEKIVSPEGKIIKHFTPEVLGKAEVSAKTLEVVRKAMVQTTQPGGTAYHLFYKFPKEIKVGAKTGTVQPGKVGYIVKDKQYYDGVFVAFAPADDPQIAFAGVVEYGYSGGGSAGKIAQAVFEEYFGLNQDEEIEDKSTGVETTRSDG